MLRLVCNTSRHVIPTPSHVSMASKLMYLCNGTKVQVTSYGAVRINRNRGVRDEIPLNHAPHYASFSAYNPSINLSFSFLGLVTDTLPMHT